jgi:hypothetical protein
MNNSITTLDEQLKRVDGLIPVTDLDLRFAIYELLVEARTSVRLETYNDFNLKTI